MNKDTCSICKKIKPTSNCQNCDSHACKKCMEFLEPATFSFFKEIPEELSHTFYCKFCYDDVVVPALDSYNEVIEQAKGVFVFLKEQKRLPKLLKKSSQKVEVPACPDRDEMILRLAFFAVQQSYNALIETEVISKQIRNSGYQKLEWRGSAVPAQVDGEKLDREDLPKNLRNPK